MLIIDRFEGKYAIVEADNEIFNLPKSTLPANAKEGDIIQIRVMEEETMKRKKDIEEKFKNLLE